MKRVLIVDGDEVRRVYLERELNKIYEVHLCARGDLPVQMIETLRPDALIINLALPYLDGMTVLRQLKHRPPAILALTNLISNRIIADAAALGVRDMLIYPCSIKTIAAHLEDLLFAKT